MKHLWYSLGHRPLWTESHRFKINGFKINGFKINGFKINGFRIKGVAGFSSVFTEPEPKSVKDDMQNRPD